MPGPGDVTLITQHWNRLQAFYLDAVAGFAFVLRHVESEQKMARDVEFARRFNRDK